MSEKSLINVIPNSVDTAAQNITDPITKNAGTTLGDIWYLVFGGITHAADKKRLKYSIQLQQYEKELKTAMALIPEDKKKDPSIQITGQALEASKYCIDSQILREMFVKLISGTMNSDTDPSIHPSFPEILKQMDERDAKLLFVMKSSQDLPIVSLGINRKNGGYYPMHKNLLLPYNDLSSHDTTLSASALERAGLVSMTMQTTLTDENLYRPFEKTEEYMQIHTVALLQESTMNFQKGICSLTNLGRAFIQVCV